MSQEKQKNLEEKQAEQYYESQRLQYEIEALQARIKRLEVLRDAVNKMRKESLAAGVWYTGIGCEFAEAVDDALAACEPQATEGENAV